MTSEGILYCTCHAGGHDGEVATTRGDTTLLSYGNKYAADIDGPTNLSTWTKKKLVGLNGTDGTDGAHSPAPAKTRPRSRTLTGTELSDLDNPTEQLNALGRLTLSDFTPLNARQLKCAAEIAMRVVKMRHGRSFRVAQKFQNVNGRPKHMYYMSVINAREKCALVTLDASNPAGGMRFKIHMFA